MIDYGFGASLGPLDWQLAVDARKWRNNPLIWKWCRQTDLISEATQFKWYESLGQDPSIKMYAVHSSFGEFIGVCGFTSYHPINRIAEFSLYIAPEYQKKGYGKAALQTLCTHGFRNLNLHSIWGESFEGNPAIKTFEDLGFKQDGVRRQCYYKDGKYINAILFSVMEYEWKWLYSP